MHVVVFDHHLAGGTLPSADVIVDPHIETKSDFSQYCGAGIAFRFAKEILPKEFMWDREMKWEDWPLPSMIW